MPARNPPWSREEVIIALDVFMQHMNALPGDKSHPIVSSLSNQLRKLAEDQGTAVNANYRNPVGVFMKLRNFEYLTGSGKGLPATSKLDKELFARYRNDPAALAWAAQRARAGKTVPDASVPEGVPKGFSPGVLAKTTDAALDSSLVITVQGQALVRPRPRTLGEIANQERDIRIPRYQRSYSWRDNEVSDFVRDVQELTQKVAAGNESAQHFFGGMVMVRTADDMGWDVIDGQQRLTTYFLALSVLERAFIELGERAQASGDSQLEQLAQGNAARIREDFVWTSGASPLTGKAETRPRFQPTEQDRTVFAKVLNGDAIVVARGSHRLLDKARDLLWHHLILPILARPGSDKERRRALLALQYALVRASVVVQLTAQDLNAAYRLFIVLNDRGMQLSEGDLLRAQTLEALEAFPAEFDVAAAYWDTILGYQGAVVQGFLRSYFPSILGRRADIWNLVEQYREHIFGIGSGPCSTVHAAKTLVKKIAQLADEIEPYSDMREGRWPFPESSQNKASRVRVRRLVKTLRHDLALPLLLAGSKRLDEPAFADLVMLLERFAFRYKNVGNGHADGAARAYYKHSKRLRGLKASAPWPREALVKELRALQADNADDGTFESLLLDRLSYDRTGQRGNIKWLLAAVEDFGPWLAKGPNRPKVPVLSTAVVLDTEATQLDHVYPQKAKVADKDAALEDVKHQIGNLALLETKDNALASNEPFKKKKKKETYKLSKVAETKALAKKTTWTAATVEKRQKRLAALATELTAL